MSNPTEKKPDSVTCDLCGAAAYRTATFYYLETWGEDYCAGDALGFSLRKKRQICGPCGEVIRKALDKGKVKP